MNSFGSAGLNYECKTLPRIFRILNLVKLVS